MGAATVAVRGVPTVGPSVVQRDGSSVVLTVLPRPAVIAARDPNVPLPAMAIAHPNAAAAIAMDGPIALVCGASRAVTQGATAGAAPKPTASPRANPRALAKNRPAI